MLRAWLVIGLAACGRIDFADHVTNVGTPDDAMAVTGDGGCGGVEICDGIDNNCNGEVDEGCPCSPFDVMLPQSTNGVPTSIGVGWIVEIPSAYLRLDDSGGFITQQAESVLPTSPTNLLAWDGVELSVIDPTAGVIDFIALADGSVTPGPSLGIANLAAGVLHWNGSGYDVAVAPTAGPLSLFRTDTAGAPNNAVSSSGAAYTSVVPLATTTRNGGPSAAWYEQNGGAFSRTAYADADPPATLAASYFTGGNTGATIASDGTTVLFVWSGELWSFDNTGMNRVMTLPVSTSPTSVTRAGAAWSVVGEQQGTKSQTVYRYELDDTLAVTQTTMIKQVTYTTQLAEDPPIIIGDARRSLILWGYRIDTGPTLTELFAACY